MKMIKFLCLGLFALTMLSVQSVAAEQTFAKPKQGGLRIDWCYQYGSQCGKPAADRFCQTKGFTQSNDFVEDVDIGAASIATLVLGTGQVCNAPNCDGFTYVTCEKTDYTPPPPPGLPPGGGGETRTYQKPRLGGLRLNYCFKKGRGCDGQTAADAFCDSKGYDDAADFQQSSPLSPLYPTRYIGNGRKCTDLVCYSFAKITCENQP
jgi:hypothetical protein